MVRREPWGKPPFGSPVSLCVFKKVMKSLCFGVGGKCFNRNRYVCWKKMDEKIISQYALCSACLRRLARGLQEPLVSGPAVGAQDCWLCHGLLTEVPHFAGLIESMLTGFEYASFLVGCKVDDEILSREAVLWQKLGVQGEPIKMEVNREVGKLLEPRLGKPVDFTHPDIVATIDTSFDVVSLQIKSLYVYGRYRKMSRGIPQTRWPCRICHGKGCRSCGFKGKMYETSVEELIAGPLLAASQGSEHALHGCGREDIDARMLGTGRPFVVEIKNPRIRSLDLGQLTSMINSAAASQAEALGLRYTGKEDVERLKSAEFRKVYRVLLEMGSAVPKERFIKTVQGLRGATIQQFTPTRVAHRRAHRIRERTIYVCDVESVADTRANLLIETESGTYIKEFVSGDGGKTTPNLSDLLGTPCVVRELDVVDVKGE
jgi:tRNA pseudouridine synthase 10